MSTETHNSGQGNGDAPFHETVTFEPRDINVATVAKLPRRFISGSQL